MATSGADELRAAQYSRRGVSSAASAFLMQEETQSSASYLLRSRTSAEPLLGSTSASVDATQHGAADEETLVADTADTSSLTSTDSDVATNDAAAGDDELATSTAAVVQRAGSRRRV